MLDPVSQGYIRVQQGWLLWGLGESHVCPFQLLGAPPVCTASRAAPSLSQTLTSCPRLQGPLQGPCPLRKFRIALISGP